MKLISAHWTLHPEKAEGLYYDASGKPRSPWYDNEIESKKMSKAAVARELDISYELSVESIVYREFGASHIYRGKIELNPELPIIRYFDYGRVNCTTFAQKDKQGRIFFFHEIILTNSGTAEQARAAVSYSADLRHHGGFQDYDDPAGSYKDHRSETTDVQILEAADIFPTHYISAATQARKKARISLTKQKLSERIDGQETILVHESCKTIIDAFQSGYRYVEDINGNILDEIHEEHPYEDVMDCVGGTILETFTARPSNIQPVVGQRRPIKNKYTRY